MLDLYLECTHASHPRFPVTPGASRARSCSLRASIVVNRRARPADPTANARAQPAGGSILPPARIRISTAYAPGVLLYFPSRAEKGKKSFRTSASTSIY